MDLYLRLSSISRFRDVTVPTSYSHVPTTWSVIITDVVNSTTAIANGKYKEVNTAGALAIIAITNQNIRDHIPFVFGGDGITLLCPPEFLEQLKDILHGVREFVKENFALDLRIGIIGASEVLQAGYELLVGKFSEKKPMQQALFWGDGYGYAEQLIKSTSSKYSLPPDYQPHVKASFSGFSCPFVDVKSENGCIFSLIVKKGTNSRAYENSINELLDLLGNEEDYFPISFNNLDMGKKLSDLSVWATVASGKKNGFKYGLIRYLLTALTRILSRNKKSMQKQYAESMTMFTDYRKIDGSLKMVFGCSKEKALAINNWLEKKEMNGDIRFGIHESESCLITCLFNGSKDSKELHLIDGSNGGYTLAAKALKEKCSRGQGE